MGMSTFHRGSVLAYPLSNQGLQLAAVLSAVILRAYIAIILSLLTNKAKYSSGIVSYLHQSSLYIAIKLHTYERVRDGDFGRFRVLWLQSVVTAPSINNVDCHQMFRHMVAWLQQRCGLKRISYSTRGFACVGLTETPKTFAPSDPNGDLFSGAN